MNLRSLKALGTAVVACGLVLLGAQISAAAPHTPHAPVTHVHVIGTPSIPHHTPNTPHHPNPPSRPTPVISTLPSPHHSNPGGTRNVNEGCPGVPVSCPVVASCQGGLDVWKLFYAYPGRSNTMHSTGLFQLAPHSNGMDFANDTGSVTLTDDDGVVIEQMDNLHFSGSGNNFAASNQDGFLSIGKVGGMYSYDFTFDNPNLPAGFFRVRYHLCINVGDDGLARDIVCQKKPFNGFVCHE